MKTLSITRRDASLLYYWMEQGNLLKDLTLGEIAAADRLGDAFNRSIGEYPATKGPEATVVDERGKPTGEKRRTWKFDYPCATFVQMSIEADDDDLLKKVWDKTDKARFIQSPELRKQAARIQATLYPGEPAVVAKKRK